MVDCTRTLPHSTPVCRTHVLALTISLIALVLSAFPAAAAADGDPASDVLATQTVYLPQDTAATATQQSELGAIETAAQKSGYQIRVAMIATPSDLGSVGRCGTSHRATPNSSARNFRSCTGEPCWS